MKRFIISLLGLAVHVSLAAQDGSFDWQARGFRVLEESVTGDERHFRLADAAGRECTVFPGTNAPTAMAVERIARVCGVLADWPGLKLRSLRFYIRPRDVQAIALPESFVVEGSDLAPFMPAGMVFYAGNTLRYNFRMLKDAVSMKLVGPFIDRREFVSMLQWAIGDPVAFSRSSTTGARVDRLEGELAALKNRLEAESARSREDKAALEAELARVRLAAAFLHNTGFLRGPRPLDMKKVARLLELKRARPALGIEEAETILERENLELPERVIELVFYFWFNDFRE